MTFESPQDTDYADERHTNGADALIGDALNITFEVYDDENVETPDIETAIAKAVKRAWKCRKSSAIGFAQGEIEQRVMRELRGCGLTDARGRPRF